MAAVRSIKNQFRGVNPHLQSYWQLDGNWAEFHTYHIGHLGVALKHQLRALGYTTSIENSLQIHQADDLIERPRSDLTIYDPDPFRPFQPVQISPSGAQALVAPLSEVIVNLEEPMEYRAVAIYELLADRRLMGEPVAWIELLSPSNKQDKQERASYIHKRRGLLENGIVFIEIDYLHETRPTLNHLPPYYPHKLPDAHPFHISVIDPRPHFSEGQVLVYPSLVDQPIPTITIPLNRDDTLPFNFDRVYQHTFEEVLYGDEIDYGQLPLRFERYRPADQQRIVARLLTVLEAAHAGADLDQAPLPLLYEELGLVEGLAKLRALGVPF